MRLDEPQSAPVDVLIADDDGALRCSVRSLLETHGYTCAEAKDGPDALEAARSLTPRCVLLDLDLPLLDGFAVARQLRAELCTRAARLYCLNGRGDAASRRAAFAAGYELCLTKPADATAILRAVGRRPADPESCECAGLTRVEAEDLLDWRAANRYPPAAVLYEEGVGFAVRWSRSGAGDGRQAGSDK